MLGTISRRVLSAIPTFLVVVLSVFLLLALMPGDPAAIIAGEYAGPEQVAATREELGLDRSAVQQFIDFASDAIHGDLGKSLYTKRPVAESIGQALPVTVSLALAAMTFAIFVGVGSGIIAAIRQGGIIDRAISGLAALFVAVPPFVVAFVLVAPLAINRTWFPATGYESKEEGVSTWFSHLVLPGAALGVALAAEIARQVRGALIGALEQDYIRTGRAAGLLERSVVGKHALRNSAIPVVTILGLQCARVLSGAIVIEAVFAMPGLGSLGYQAVLNRDVPMIQGITLVSAAIVMLVSLLADICCLYLNPRMRTA